MLELARTSATVVACAAHQTALDVLADASTALVLRVAPDEALLIGPPEEADRIVAGATGVLTDVDHDALVLDATDGWAMLTVGGPDARVAFARLSALRLPDRGWVQGRVAGVPTKVVAAPDVIHLLVPAMWADHVRALVHRAASDLRVEETDDVRAWAGDVRDERVTP